MKLQIRFAAAVLSVGLALSVMDATAVAGTPITHELLWMMKRVGAPVVSPDGKWVVFSVLEPSRAGQGGQRSVAGPCRRRSGATPNYQHACTGEWRRLVARQSQHRLQHQTRRR
jgi:hypothetical protein